MLASTSLPNAFFDRITLVVLKVHVKLLQFQRSLLLCRLDPLYIQGWDAWRWYAIWQSWLTTHANSTHTIHHTTA